VKDGIIVGTVSVVVKDEGLYVRSMAVLPNNRGMGIGRKLLEKAEEFALANNLKRLFLNTTPFLLWAIELYSSFGFRRIQEAPNDLFGTPLFTMEKIL
jgi:N-acetylglutamate synthase-like GNAT family acetyltransferase